MARYALRFTALGYLAVLLCVPVGLVFWRAFEHGLATPWHAVTTPEARHAFWLTILIAVVAVPANTIFGVVLALAIVLLYGRLGWFGPWLARHGIEIVFALPGMILATIFVSLPFVVREVVPVLREIGTE